MKSCRKIVRVCFLKRFFIKLLILSIFFLQAVVSILSSEKNASINVALILRSELAECLEDKDDDSLAVVQMKSSMKNQFDRRFLITDLVLAASIMDPRFMNLKMVSEELSRRNQSKTEFLIEIVHAEIKETDVNIASVAVRSSNSSTSSNMSTLAVKHSLSQINNSSMIEQECQAYISTAHPNHVRDDEVLQYWNQRRVQFPWLSALAAKLLCIPATSTPSERVFNVAGLTISARRTKLHPKNVDKIIFIHDNYQLCKTSLLDQLESVLTYVKHCTLMVHFMSFFFIKIYEFNAKFQINYLILTYISIFLTNPLVNKK